MLAVGAVVGGVAGRGCSLDPIGLCTNCCAFVRDDADCASHHTIPEWPLLTHPPTHLLAHPSTHPLPLAAELTRTMDEQDAGMTLGDKARALKDAFPPAYWQALAVVMALYLVSWIGACPWGLLQGLV